MTMRRRALLASAATGIVGTTLVGPAWAQSFPSRPIRWVVPFTPAGNYDVTSRIVGEVMGRHLGQTIVIDNKPGAGGIVGVEAAVAAPADGYTVVMASFSVLNIAPLMARKPPLQPALTPISMLTTVPMVMATSASGKFADWKAMMAQAKSAPGSVSVGHAGNGSTNHVAILRTQTNEKVAFNIIPYRGSAPGLNDLMGGQIDCYTDQLTTSLPHIRAGKLKALVVFALERIPELPGVPTLRELGGTGFDGGTTAGLFARVETPKPIIVQLNSAVMAALNDPTVRQRMGELGATVRPTTPEAYATQLEADKAAVEPLIAAGLLKAE
jgi:tripartite-type tricarboxylate transporter receptor subunit TctC